MKTLQQICGEKLFAQKNHIFSNEIFRSKFDELSQKFPHCIHKIIPPSIVRDFLFQSPFEDSIVYFTSLSQLEVLDLTYVHVSNLTYKIASICEMMEDWRIVNTGSEVVRECKLITTKEIVLTADQLIELLNGNFSWTKRFPKMTKISIPTEFATLHDLWTAPDALRIIAQADQGFNFTLPLKITSLDQLNGLRNLGFLNHPGITFSQIKIIYPPDSADESNELLKLADYTERFILEHCHKKKFESHTLQSLEVLSAPVLEQIALPNAVGKIRINGTRILQLAAPFIAELSGQHSLLPHLNLAHLSRLILTRCDWTFSDPSYSEIYLPNVTSVKMNASFKGLTSLVIPRATHAILESMHSLSRIIGNNLTYLNLVDCPHLTYLEVAERLRAFHASRSQIPSLHFSYLENLTLINCFVSPLESSKTSLTISNTKEINIWGGFHKLTHLHIPHATNVIFMDLNSLNYLFAPNIKKAYFQNCPSLDTFKGPKSTHIQRLNTLPPPLITKKRIITAIALTAFIYLFLSYAQSLMQTEDEESLFG